MQEEHDLGRSRAIGERALGYMKEFGIKPDPIHYALLYNHTAGYSRALTNAVMRAVQDRGHLAEADAKEIYDEFLSVQTSLGLVRHELSRQTADIAETISAASDQASDFGVSLHGAQRDLSDCNGEQAADILRNLCVASAQMAEQNRDLEEQLADSRRQVDDLKRRIASLRRQPESDALTGLPGRGAFRQCVAQALQQVHQRSAPLSVLMADIDSFKAYNRVNGAEVADKIIRFVGQLIAGAVTKECTVARYGGDSFGVLLPNTRLESALKLAEGIRSAAQAKTFVRKSSGRSVGRITLSIGVALYGYGDTADALIDRAIECARKAKELGRNRVRCAANSDTQV